MRSKKVKKKVGWRQYLPLLFIMPLGAICGIYIGRYIKKLTVVGGSAADTILLAAVLIMGLYLAIFLQLILHEAGHWFFGRLTGYRFASFRIGSFMWIKQDGKTRFCKFKLAGTGGQCLMTPPEMRDGKMPYVLYNLGGAISNIFFAALFAAAAGLAKGSGFASALFMIFALVGAAFALMNGIPLRFGTIDNDGYNALSLGRDPAALRAFWSQMQINEQSMQGVRIKDMPEAWFEMPEKEAMKNSMIAAIGVFCCNRMMDQMAFEKAGEAMRELLSLQTGIVGLHRSLLTVDLIYCELVGAKRPEKLAEMLDKPQKRFMKTMKQFPGVLRTEYAYALLLKNNQMKAAQIKAAFEKMAKSYPNPADIDSERELMAYAACRAAL